MNVSLQTILALTALAFALAFLIKKFFFKKPVPSKGCGMDDCGCH